MIVDQVFDTGKSCFGADHYARSLGAAWRKRWYD